MKKERKITLKSEEKLVNRNKPKNERDAGLSKQGCKNSYFIYIEGIPKKYKQTLTLYSY